MSETMMTPVVLALEHVQLAMPAGQEDAAEEFYGGVLGFRRVEKPPHLEARGGCWFEANGVNLHLGVEANFVPARKAHPAFIVSSLDEVKLRLEGAGAEIVIDTQIGSYERFYTNDPFGNRLEFMEPIGQEH
jgi:catechol 2,3-dioxygenase-like lactoylglutathione lyase family enzyme